MKALTRILPLAVALAAGVALAQDTPDDIDPQDPEEPEPIAEAMLDPIPIAMGADDFEFAFELIRFDLQQADKAEGDKAKGDKAEGAVSFEIELESQPSYISDLKLDKTLLSFEPDTFTGKVIASLDVAEDATSDGVDEIVLHLTAKDKATKPQEGKITIPLDLLERSDLFLLARIHTENLSLRNVFFTTEGVMPEVVPNLQALVKARKDEDVTDPHGTVMMISALATFYRDPAAFASAAQSAAEDNPLLEGQNLPFRSVDDLVKIHIDKGTPFGRAAERLTGLQKSGIEEIYIAGTLPEAGSSPGPPKPSFSILRPPPPPELDEDGNPKLDDEGNPLPEEGRETKWKAFQSITELTGMIAHEVDGWMVAIPRPRTAPPPPPEGADAESVLLSALPTRLMEGMVDEAKADGIPLLQALEDAPESDVSIGILMPAEVRELALADFEKSKADFPPEDRHLLPTVQKLLKILDHKWIRVSITFGENPDLELLAKFDNKRTPEIIREAYAVIIAKAVEAIKVEPHRNAKIVRVRQLNRDINVRMIRRIKLLAEEGFLQLEEPEKLIKAVLTDALGLQGEPRDDGEYAPPSADDDPEDE